MRIDTDYKKLRRGHGDWYNAHIYRSQRHSVAILIRCAVLGSVLLIAGCWASGAQAEASVAVVLAAEACSEGEQGIRAVAGTIRNRALRRGISVERVVSEKNQYYGYTAGNRHRLYAQCRAVADRIAAELRAGTLQDITGGAEFFLLPGERVRSWHGKRTVRIGAHTFYRGR